MESDAVTTERRQHQGSTGNNPPDTQPYYGSVGHGPAPFGHNTSGYLVGNLFNFDEESDLDEVEEEWFVDEELGRQGLYRGTY
jgi:hypothetical protein